MTIGKATGKSQIAGAPSCAPHSPTATIARTWLNGVLASHLASFAGDQHRAPVSLTSVEPQVSYTFENGWSVQTSPTISYDWTADAWTIPLGADVGSAFTVGSQAMSVLVGAYDLVKRPSDAPASIVRVQLTVIFPSPER